MDSYEVYKHFIESPSDTEETLKLKRAYRSWFIGHMPAKELKSEELVLYLLLKYIAEYNTRLSDKSVEAFCRLELQNLLVKYKIKVVGTETLSFSDTAQVLAIVDATKTFLVNFLDDVKKEPANIEDFVPDAQLYFTDKLKVGLSSMYNNAVAIVDSVDVRQEAGAQASLNFVEERTVELAQLYGRNVLDDFIDGAGEDKPFKFVMDFGIKPLDAVFGGCYTTEMISIESGPGVGKTKFACGHVAWRGAVIFKQNTIYYTLEQTKLEIEALLIARHYRYLYNTFTNEEYIRKPEKFELLPVEEQQKINAARYDLFESGKYGKLTIVATDLKVNTIVPDIKRRSNLSEFNQIIVVDYIGMVEQADESKYNVDEYKVIGQTLKFLKRYARFSGATVFVVQQQTGEGVERIQAGKPHQPKDAQGGMIAYRSPDKNIVLWKTDELSAQNKRGVRITKSRGSADTLSIICNTVLGSCLFYSDSTEVV